MNNATKRICIAAPLIVVAFAVVLSAAPATAQDTDPIFTIDHYMTYLVIPPITLSVSLGLQDQFGESQHSALLLERFSTPADKNNEGIIDPSAHLSWWRLLDGIDNPPRRVVVRNQFGEFELDVLLAAYLLAPAEKNVAPNPGSPGSKSAPLDGPGTVGRDHYKCYDVVGESVEKMVSLDDQFQHGPADVLIPLYLCNPVQKNHLDGTGNFPILKPTEHLVCYELTFPSTLGLSTVFTDQFVQAPIDLETVDILCVPSEKDEVVQVEDGSWGKFKSIYR